MHDMTRDTPDAMRDGDSIPPAFPPPRRGVAPFDTARLDALMEEAGLDALVATSRHSVQYLLGGYYFFFFQGRDAIGLSRYLPVVVYCRGRPELTTYIGNRLERYEVEQGRIWAPEIETVSWGTSDAMERARAHLARMPGPLRRIGVELAHMPADAASVLDAAFGAMVDARLVFERLRAVKTPLEIAMLRAASDRVVDSMLATFGACTAGMTKVHLAERLRLEEVRRGLVFEYCLVTAGSSLNRAPSPERIAEGDILSLDSGGNYHGYIGDLCRMAILGEPDQELQDLLGAVQEIQAQARAVVRAGVLGGAVQEAGLAGVAASPHRAHLEFLAHGMGLVQHEAPWLTGSGPVPYPGLYENAPLEAGMVLSVETTLHHPQRGFVKLEDTVVVTAEGSEGLGDDGRGWTRAGTG
jgi:Xaa-Pro aminopeptidase